MLLKFLSYVRRTSSSPQPRWHGTTAEPSLAELLLYAPIEHVKMENAIVATLLIDTLLKTVVTSKHVRKLDI